MSHHPSSGPRPDMDDMLNVIDLLYAPEGKGASPFTAAHFEAAAHLQPAPWREVHTMAASLKAVLHAKQWPDATGILLATAEQRHPQLGSGLLLLLNIPTSHARELILSLSHELNAAEARDWARAYFYGAWCPGQDPYPGLTFAGFLPAQCCRPGLDLRRWHYRWRVGHSGRTSTYRKAADGRGGGIDVTRLRENLGVIAAEQQSSRLADRFRRHRVHAGRHGPRAQPNPSSLLVSHFRGSHT